jgi:hypothetical protein
MNRGLALRLLETFAETERGLKSGSFLIPYSVKWAPYPLAKADWEKFASEIGPKLRLTEEMTRVLVRQGPMTELVVDGGCVFVKVDMPGASDGEKAINAAKQVRNNLFHGAKLLGEGDIDDDTFIRNAISVLELAGHVACAKKGVSEH